MTDEGSPARRITPRLLIVVAGILLFVAVLTVYASLTIFSAARFADRASSTLKQPEVRALVADRVTDAITKVQPDLIGARPLVEAAADAVAGSPAFQRLLDGALADVHRTVFGAEQETVTLALADVGVLVAETLRAIAPEIARKIPADVEPALTSIGEDREGILATAARIAEDVEGAGVISLVLSLALFGAAFALSHDRRRTAGQAAVAVACVGVAGILLFEAGRLLAASGFEEPGDRAAVRSVYGGFFLDYRTWNIVLALGGLVVAGAAASLLRPMPASEMVKLAWGRVTAPPPTPRLRAARAVALAAGGIVVIAAPQTVLLVVAVVVGVLMLYAGTVEFLAIVLPPERVTQAERRRLSRLASRAGRAAIAAALLIALIVGVALLSNAREDPAFDLRACNGSADLCDRTLAEVAFPSTHNAMSSADQRRWLFAQHEGGITAQLEAGIRGLLIDTHYGVATDKGVYTLLDRGSTSRGKIEEPLGDRFVETAMRLRSRIGYRGGGRREVFLCHAFCELGAIEAAAGLDEVREFLVTNPSEVVILSVENDLPLEATIKAFEDSGIKDMAWSEPIRPGKVPTLRQMIEADRRVLVMVWQRGPLGRMQFGDVPWLHPQFDVVQETPFEFRSPRALESPESCRANEGRPSNPLFLLNHWIESAPYYLPSNARRVNSYPFLIRRARMCQRLRGRLPNLVAVDFFREGDVLGVARTLNRRSPPERPQGAAGAR